MTSFVIALDFPRTSATIRFEMALFGVLNVNKPSGLTSYEVVDHVVRLTTPARSGHAGTLDPLATGVLVICVGKATRLIQYIQRMRKYYHATFLLGQSSDTDDIDGHVVEISGAIVPSRQMIDQAAANFLGEIEQRPPAYSAVKLSGQRAYQLARAGQPPQLPPRRVVIHRLVVVRYQYPVLELEIDCGSGTYVRSLGRDLAAMLGTACVLSQLERTAIGHFHVADAVALDDLTADTLAQHLQPALAAVVDLPRVELSATQLTEIRHGRPISINSTKILPTTSTRASGEASMQEEWAALDSVGRLVAILRERIAGQLWPVANFI